MWNDLAQAVRPAAQQAPAPGPQAPRPPGPPQGAAPPPPGPQAGPPPGGAPQGGGQQVPDYIAQNVDPKNPVAMELLGRVEKLTPQDIQAFVGGIQPGAVAVVKKIIPEIGFLIDRAMQSAQGGAPGPGGMPAPAPGGAPPAPQAAPPRPMPPQGAGGLRSVG